MADADFVTELQMKDSHNELETALTKRSINVATFVEARALDAEFTGTTVVIANRATVGDGGGGTFITDRTTGHLAGEDNDGTTLVNALGHLLVRAGDWASSGVDARWFGYVPDYVKATDIGTDNTAALAAALDVSDWVKLPIGDALVSDKLLVENGKKLTGVNRVNSTLFVNSTFNMAATGVIEMGTTEPSAVVTDLGIFFVQDTTETVRANVVQYPPAFDCTATARGIIDRVRISNAWNGIDATGNSGGMWIGDIECCAFNRGLHVDGSLDFFHVDRWHHWPFGCVGTALQGVYDDGQTVDVEVGRCDNFDCGSITGFHSLTRFTDAGGGVGPATAIPSQIDSIALDGDGSRLEILGGSHQIGKVYTTTATQNANTIEVSGGRTIIASAHITGAGNFAFINVTGGDLMIDGGWGNHLTVGSSFATVSGGCLSIKSMFFELPASARTVPFVDQSGAGVLKLKSCQTSTAGASGPVVEIGQDNAGNDVSGNHFHNWTYTLPTSFSNGCYGPNRTLRKTFSPTVEFVTNGDFAPTYDIQTGSYWIDSVGVNFEIRLQFDCNAYTTASGSLVVKGIPVAAYPNIDVATIALGAWGNITLGGAYTQLGATSSVSLDAILLRQSGSGVGFGTITVTEIPASRQNVQLSISGIIPTK